MSDKERDLDAEERERFLRTAPPRQSQPALRAQPVPEPIDYAHAKRASSLAARLGQACRKNPRLLWLPPAVLLIAALFIIEKRADDEVARVIRGQGNGGSNVVSEGKAAVKRIKAYNEEMKRENEEWDRKFKEDMQALEDRRARAEAAIKRTDQDAADDARRQAEWDAQLKKQQAAEDAKLKKDMAERDARFKKEQAEEDAKLKWIRGE